MSKYITILLFVIPQLTLIAQEEYIPTVIENAHWYLYYGGNSYCYAHTFKGDTIINDIIYKKLYEQVYHEAGFIPDYERVDYFEEVKDEKIIGYYREDTLQRKIYARFEELNILCAANEEHLVFDFDLIQNDTIMLGCLYRNPDYPAKASFIQLDTIYNAPIKKIYFEFIHDKYIPEELIVEGFGSPRGPYYEVWNGSIYGHETSLVEYCVGSDIECISKLNGGVNNIKQQHQESKLTIYPNPTSKVINLTLDNQYNKLSYHIYNLQGKLQKKGNLNSDTKKQISIERLITGSYFIVLFEGERAIGNSIFIKAR